MKSRLLLGSLAAGCSLLASCYPWQEHPRRPAPNRPDASVTNTEQQRIQEQRDALKKRDEELARQQSQAGNTTTNTPRETGTPSEGPKPAETRRADYQFANPVPGKEGFVFSPYNNKIVDVRDIPSGTLVQDPNYPAAEKKYFRVP